MLLASPDCCFRSEMVKHPRTRHTLAFVPTIFGADELMPKEQALLNLCLQEKAKGRNFHPLQRDARHHVQAEEGSRAGRPPRGGTAGHDRNGSARGLDPRLGRPRCRRAAHQPGADQDRSGPAGLPNYRVPADGVQRVHPVASRAAVVEDRAVTPAPRGFLRLCRQFAGHLPAADEQEDRSGAEHIGRCT